MASTLRTRTPTLPLGNEAVASAYGPLSGLPTKFLIDKNGNIVEKFFGPVPRAVLEKKIETLL